MQSKFCLVATIATLLSLTNCAPAPAPAPGCGFGCAAAIGGGLAAGALLADSGNDNNKNTNTNNNAANTNTGKIYCSADTSDAAVISWAQDPGWASSMKNCLNQLNNGQWNGYECVPNSGNDTVIGVNFGFYKGGKNVASGQTCYDQCEACLAEGINNLRAVTTSCKWDGGDAGNCWMGFNWGG